MKDRKIDLVKLKKIDFHIHMGKSSSGKDYTSQDLIESMDANNIEVSGLSLLNGTDVRVLNDKVNAICKENPTRIVPFAYINPRDEYAVDEVHRTLGEMKFKGVKFHSWKHGYTPDNNRQLDKVIDAISEYSVPILTHTGTAPLSLPQSWAKVAKRHPDCTFVFAHIGYLDYGYACVDSVRDLDNVYVDTSGQSEIQILQYAMEELGPDKIIFATDWPYKYPLTEILKLEVFEGSEEDYNKVFYENSKKLLKL